MADINVTFAAAGESLTDYVNRLRSQFQTLDAQAVATGQKISQAFAKIGLSAAAAFPTMSPQMQNALGQYQASLIKVAGATAQVAGTTTQMGQAARQVAGATTQAAGATTQAAGAATQAAGAATQAAGAMTQMGQAARQTGINVGNMVERMVIRMAVLGVAFKAVEFAAKEMWSGIIAPGNLEAATNRFEALSTAGAGFDKELAAIGEVAQATGTDIKALYGPAARLEDAALGPEELKDALTAVAEAARATGVPLEHIADLAAKVKLNEASVPQMRELAKLSGDFKDSSMESVSYLEAQAKILPIIEQQEQAAARAAEQFDAAQQRQTDRQVAFTEQVAAAQAKAAKSGPTRMMTAWGMRVAPPGETLGMTSWGAAADIPSAKDELTAKFAAAARGAKVMVGGMKLPQDEVDQYIRGLNALGEQAGKTGEQILRMGLDRKYVMGVGREAAQDEIRAIRETEQAQRTANREAKETEKLSVGAEIFENFKKANAQAAEFEKHQQTIQGNFERFGAVQQYFKEHPGEILGMEAGYFAPVSPGLKGFGVGAPGGPSGKPEVTETNSSKIEEHNQKIEEHLRGLLEIFGGHSE